VRKTGKHIPEIEIGGDARPSNQRIDRSASQSHYKALLGRIMDFVHKR
jgi:hypothetical protein